jgi:hypothetical protein
MNYAEGGAPDHGALLVAVVADQSDRLWRIGRGAADLVVAHLECGAIGLCG